MDDKSGDGDADDHGSMVSQEEVDQDVADEVTIQYNTIQYNEKFALKNWQTHCQFNLAHKLKRT